MKYETYLTEIVVQENTETFLFSGPDIIATSFEEACAYAEEHLKGYEVIGKLVSRSSEETQNLN